MNQIAQRLVAGLLGFGLLALPASPRVGPSRATS